MNCGRSHPLALVDAGAQGWLELAWTAPELLKQGLSWPIGGTAPADVYSLGVCYYEIMAQRLPFPPPATAKQRAAAPANTLRLGSSAPPPLWNEDTSEDKARQLVTAIGSGRMRPHLTADELKACRTEFVEELFALVRTTVAALADERPHGEVVLTRVEKLMQ